MQELTDKDTTGKSKPVPTRPRVASQREQLLTVVKVGIRNLKTPASKRKRPGCPSPRRRITSDLAEQLGSPGLHGVRVTQVYADSTAEKAGAEKSAT